MMRARGTRAVARHIVGEDGESAADQGDGAIGMSARATSVHLRETASEAGQEVVVATTPSETLQVLGNSGEPIDARPALPSALCCQVAGDASSFRHSARRGSQHHNHPDARSGADGSKGTGGVRGCKGVGTHPASGEAAHEECLRRFRGRSAVRDVPQWRAPVDLDHSGVGHCSTDRHEACSRLFGQPPSSERARAPSRDEGDVGQGFCVVDEGGPPSDSQRDAFVGSEDGKRRAGLDEVDQSGLFAADESIGRSDKGLVHGCAPTPPPFGHGVRDRLGCDLSSRRDTDHDATRAAHRSEVLRTVEHEVGCAVQEQLVLVTGGLALHGIHDDRSAPTS